MLPQFQLNCQGEEAQQSENHRPCRASEAPTAADITLPRRLVSCGMRAWYACCCEVSVCAGVLTPTVILAQKERHEAAMSASCIEHTFFLLTDLVSIIIAW